MWQEFDRVEKESHFIPLTTFYVETFGCRSNQYDSQRLREALQEVGLQGASNTRNTDLIIVNTCTVTHTASRKARRRLRELVRECPQSKVYATGCYASADPEELGEIEGLAGVYGREQWEELLEAATGEKAHDSRRVKGDFGIRSFTGRSRALLKVQEGCDFFCAYCIVPFVRGEPRSRPLQEAVKEAQRLISRGFREIVLTGIHLGLYGRDRPDDENLPNLVRSLADLPGLERLRLSSIEAVEVDELLLKAMEHPSVCQHLHLALQSGDDETLERMGRRYTSADFMERVGMIRDHLENPAISGDVIVGFPGETDKAFAKTMEVCRKVAFSRMHIFRYSVRPGTRAAEMPGQVHSRTAKKRSKQLRKLARQLSQEWAEQFVGRNVRVLLEEQKAPNCFTGYTDRYVRAEVRGQGSTDQVRHAEIRSARNSKLQGDLIELQS
ncbi:MAG: tRNA (N(6)-L-threonylcarbamoyladenosine(37)-C(2))-methylthiotransferase MtaB [Candidatus Brocadiia bacterium]